ncbi:hypothetical protein LTR78_010089 [Recurvomyces mirabilis]|uniref:C2H2-type domain-containing protein n=1 Tax=Recurvomyces mirabilis TaxID=574656 RepID=A0AAE0WIC8_9PEZI|nr:hypothetical protein LTR78_010089 [Recurvomyces mirabilis]KAK5159805.1 hypothetical protein LTS14_001910 [Recurvomyces mirabilis]
MDDDIPLLGSYDDAESIGYYIEHRGTHRHGLFGDDVIFSDFHDTTYLGMASSHGKTAAAQYTAHADGNLPRGQRPSVVSSAPLSTAQAIIDRPQVGTGDHADTFTYFDQGHAEHQSQAALIGMSDSTEEHPSQHSNAQHSSPIAVVARSRFHHCSVCAEYFLSAENLERHAIATSHRIYVCGHDGCAKSYTRRDVFGRHKATHKGHTPHQCHACREHGTTKTFTRKDHLIQHQRKCHPDLYSGLATPYTASVVATRDTSPGSFSVLDGKPGAGTSFGQPSWSFHQNSSTSSKQSLRTSIGSYSLASTMGSVRSVEQDCPVTRLHHALKDLLGAQSDHLNVYRQLLGFDGMPDPQHTAFGLQRLVSHMLPGNKTNMQTRHATQRQGDTHEIPDDTEPDPLPFEIF